MITITKTFLQGKITKLSSKLLFELLHSHLSSMQHINYTIYTMIDQVYNHNGEAEEAP